METFYGAANGGFELITEVPYDDARLDCATCHDKSRWENADPPVDWPGTGSCLNCHDDPEGDPTAGISVERCLACHGRQTAEITTQAFTDVHRDSGFECMDCHTAAEMHGDGTEYASILESPSPHCLDCHAADSLPTNPEHSQHAENIDCSACHMQSVITCYNCHFESQLEGGGKRAFRQLSSYVMLVNRDDKVHAATFMTLTYDQGTFVVVAPYYAHSITADGRNCAECHANFGGDIAAINEYNTDGTITVTTWDGEAEGPARITGPTGIVPVPEDWSTAFQFAWLEYTGDASTPLADTDPTLWENFESGAAELTQMLYAEPLTDAQMTALGATGP